MLEIVLYKKNSFHGFSMQLVSFLCPLALHKWKHSFNVSVMWRNRKEKFCDDKKFWGAFIVLAIAEVLHPPLVSQLIEVIVFTICFNKLLQVTQLIKTFRIVNVHAIFSQIVHSYFNVIPTRDFGQGQKPGQTADFRKPARTKAKKEDVSGETLVGFGTGLSNLTCYSLKQNITVIKEICFLSCHLGWMNRRRFCLQKSGSQEHISLITIMFCFNEFTFTVQV